MMSQNSVDNQIGLAELLGNFATNFHMGAFHFVVNSLANIMQKTCTLSQNYIHTQLGCHYTSQICYLNRVIQHVLAIAGAIAQTAQKLNQLRMQTVHAHSKGCLLACFLNLLLNLFLSLLHHLFNTGRMDTSIVDELLQSNTSHLTANGVEAGNDYCFRSIVNDQINAGQGF